MLSCVACFCLPASQIPGSTRPRSRVAISLAMSIVRFWQTFNLSCFVSGSLSRLTSAINPTFCSFCPSTLRTCFDNPDVF